jgi:preprotein translocase subunit YajC
MPVLAPVLAAEETQQQATGSNIFFYVILAALVVGMFVMSRRSKKKQVDANAFRSELAPGQRVMTMSGMIGVISRVDGDVITVMSASGDESAWIRRAIRNLVSDSEWEAMTAEYPDDPDAVDAAEDAEAADDAGEDTVGEAGAAIIEKDEPETDEAGGGQTA